MPEPKEKNIAEDISREGNPWLCILDKMSAGVIVSEIPSGRFLLVNKSAESILGSFPTSRGVEDYAQYGAVHADGRSYESHEYPIARSMANGELIEREPMYYRRSDGRLLTLEISVSRMSIPDFEQVSVCTFHDVTEEYAARRAAKEASERVQLALDAGAIVGTWIGDIPGNRITADERFAHTFSFDPAHCSAGFPREELASSIHPADRTHYEAAMAEVFSNGGAFRHQFRVLDRNRAYRWVECIGRVEVDESGKPERSRGVLVDVSNWKEADEARNLLMREVDHRARNVLAIVQSVVRLTDASDPSRYQEEVIGRVDAMARAQSSLSRSNWEGGVLGDVVREELSSYASSRQFTLTGPKVTVPVEQVQPLSMIMHEMATNAVKFGALAASEGVVEIFWKTHSDRCMLTWRERGGPKVEPQANAGFGSRLIKRLAAQLGGSIEMDWQKTGLLATLAWRA